MDNPLTPVTKNTQQPSCTGIMTKSREQMIDGVKALREECQITLNTAAYWNESVRKPDEPEVIADPDGELAEIIKRCDAFVEVAERTTGLLPTL